jgi:hypothetical protein
MDMQTTPCAVGGAMRPSRPSAGGTPGRRPMRSGSDGPYTSASSKPTRRPHAAAATATFAATVLLPTPPLPEATATMCATPGRGARAR